MSPEYDVASHDGIPVYSLPDVPLISGTLAFAVGLRDESARSAGLAHLVEHLVMSRVGARGQSVNAVTSDDAVSFTARGDADLVVRFLRDAARAISSLSSITPDEILAQQKVIAAELGEGHSRPGIGALNERFGVGGLGLIDLGSPAHMAHGKEEVLGFAQLWLHRDNAAIALTGMRPDDLEVRLPSRPDGAPLDRDPCADPGASGWTLSVTPGVTLSLLVGEGVRAALLLAIGVIQNTLMNELRHARHLIYSVDVYVADWSSTTLFAEFRLDVPADKAAEVARLAVEVLRGIESSGADVDARREYEEDWRRMSGDAEVAAESLVGHAVAVLRGTSRVGARPVDPSTVSDATLGGVLRSSMGSLFVSFEGTSVDGDVEKWGADLGLAAAPPPPTHYSTFTRLQLLRELSRPGVKTFSPRMLRGLGGHQIIVDDQRVTYLDPNTGACEIAFSDAALVGHDEGAGSWVLVSSRANVIGIDESDWRGGRALGKLLDERLPHHNRYQLTT